MRIRVVLAVFLAAAALVLAHAGYYALADNGALLLILPKTASASGPPVKAVEEVSEDKCMLTYEIPRERRVRALNAYHQTRLVGTNAAYAQVMRYRMLSGAFFTQDAQKAQSAVLVLNRAAAFALFGSTDVAGETLHLDDAPYLIVGTIDDLDEAQNNLYVPATRMDAAPNAFACRLEGGVTRAYVWNALKPLGVTEAGYEEIPLGAYGKTILQQCLLALHIALLALAAFGARKAMRAWRAHVAVLRRARQRYYLGELLLHERRRVLALLLLGMGLLAAVAALLYLAVALLQNALGWPDAARLQACVAESFSRSIREMRPLALRAGIALPAFALSTLAFCVAAWKRRSR